MKRKSSDQNDEKSANGNEEEEEEDVMQIATEGKIVGEGVVDPEGIVRTKQVPSWIIYYYFFFWIFFLLILNFLSRFLLFKVEAGNADSTTGTNTGDD